MKRLLLSIIILFSISSKATQIQIDFVNGFNIDVINSTIGSPSEGTATTDAAINAIFTNYNVNHCVNCYTGQYTIIFVDYFGSDVNGFRNALQNNSNVHKTWLCYPNQLYFTFADRLYIDLSTGNNGNPIGINNGTVITTNTTLNSIFSTYNVKSMEQLIQTSSLYYELFFDGDITNLKNELDALTSVIQRTDLIGVPMLLSRSEFDKKNLIISPNPFTNNFNIQTEESISNYTLIDISGKQLITTNSKNELDKLSTSLNSGIYFLNILLENGENGNFKLVKE